ncbi:MAG: BTAD domain-containing putative transcriptional regulator, partial [Longimicrobiales bacterium]|nr:BTAD domain-containing putative transcriptional regulator [Longimicrobiales bacterium]
MTEGGTPAEASFPAGAPGAAEVGIRLLGAPALEGGDGVSRPLPGLPAAFLAYVLLARRPLTRDHMATLFWPRSDRGRALQSVRQTLSRLRALVPRPAVDGDRVLERVPGAAVTDVDALEVALAAGRVADALELWRGPLLQDFRRPESWELEDWLERERTRLERRMVLAVEAGARAAAAGGRTGEALELLRSARARFPLDEELAVLEVEVLAAAGRHQEAAAALAALGDDVSEGRRERARNLVERARGEAVPLPVPPAGAPGDGQGQSTPVPTAPEPTATAPEPTRRNPTTRDPSAPAARAPAVRSRWLLTAVAGLAALLLVLSAVRPSPEDRT